jgi:lysophospholipase L1-like esterase
VRGIARSDVVRSRAGQDDDRGRQGLGVEQTQAAGHRGLELSRPRRLGHVRLSGADFDPHPELCRSDEHDRLPADIASDLGVNVANAACPGETSSSFIDNTAQSNGCETQPNGSPGYRAAFPLHVSYTGSQLKYAVKYLKSTPNVTLVSLMIGANDYFLCQQETADQCQSATETDAVFATLKKNLKKILSTIRRYYHGQLVLVGYYSPTSALDGLSEVSNAFEQRVAAPYHVEFADGFNAYEAAEQSAGFPDDPCSAGLLTELSGGGCGIHSSDAGQTVLAQTVESVVQTAP